MRKRFPIIPSFFFLLSLIPAGVRAQITISPDTTGADSTVAAVVAGEPAAVPVHDWEFALTPDERAPAATGTVRVTEGEEENLVVVDVRGVPALDSLDQAGIDVGAYTVWIVPSKERARESTLAGALTIGADGSGRLESSTPLATFGVFVLASPSAAPAALMPAVRILSGIPIVPEPPAEEEASAAEPIDDEAAPPVTEPAAMEPAAVEPPAPAQDEPEATTAPGQGR